MNLNSEMRIVLSEAEAKTLWAYLEKRRNELDEGLLPFLRRLETGLWDRMTIDEFAESRDE